MLVLICIFLSISETDCIHHDLPINNRTVCIHALRNTVCVPRLQSLDKILYKCSYLVCSDKYAGQLVMCNAI